MVRFAKWRAGESFVCISVWSKGGLEFFSPLAAYTFFCKTDLSFLSLKSPATRSATSG